MRVSSLSVSVSQLSRKGFPLRRGRSENSEGPAPVHSEVNAHAHAHAPHLSSTQPSPSQGIDVKQGASSTSVTRGQEPSAPPGVPPPDVLLECLNEIPVVNEICMRDEGSCSIRQIGFVVPIMGVPPLRPSVTSPRPTVAPGHRPRFLRDLIDVYWCLLFLLRALDKVPGYRFSIPIIPRGLAERIGRQVDGVASLLGAGPRRTQVDDLNNDCSLPSLDLQALAAVPAALPVARIERSIEPAPARREAASVQLASVLAGFIDLRIGWCGGEVRTSSE